MLATSLLMGANMREQFSFTNECYGWPLVFYYPGLIFRDNMNFGHFDLWSAVASLLCCAALLATIVMLAESLARITTQRRAKS